jgi:hypothetical protein
LGKFRQERIARLLSELDHPFLHTEQYAPWRREPTVCEEEMLDEHRVCNHQLHHVNSDSER